MNWVSIGSGNGLSPFRGQAITWTNARLLLIGLLGTNFSAIRIQIQHFSFMNVLECVVCMKFCPREELMGILYNEFKNYFEITATSPRVQWISWIWGLYMSCPPSSTEYFSVIRLIFKVYNLHQNCSRPSLLFGIIYYLKLHNKCTHSRNYANFFIKRYENTNMHTQKQNHVDKNNKMYSRKIFQALSTRETIA